MGGKAAMALALRWPDQVGRVLVADIAPVPYEHGNDAVAAAMAAIRLTPSLTRQDADAALAEAVPRSDIRAFLLQNLRFGASPHWRIGLAEIAAAIPDLEGWNDLPGCYTGPSLFVTGANSDYVRPEQTWSLSGPRQLCSDHQAVRCVHAESAGGALRYRGRACPVSVPLIAQTQSSKPCRFIRSSSGTVSLRPARRSARRCSAT